MDSPSLHKNCLGLSREQSFCWNCLGLAAITEFIHIPKDVYLSKLWQNFGSHTSGIKTGTQMYFTLSQPCSALLISYSISFTWRTLCTLYCPSQVWTIVQNNSCIANYGLLHPNWKLSVIIQWTWMMTSLWIFIVAYLEMIYGRVLITAKKDTHLAFKLANGLLGHLGQKESAWNLGLRLKLELSGKQLLFWHILQC